MTGRKRAVAALSAIIDGANGDLVLTLKDENGNSFDIGLHPGIIANLAVTLLKIGATAQSGTRNQKSITAQPMTLTAAIPAVGPSGQPVLDLVLEGTMHFPVTFPINAIPIMQNALATLANATSAPPSPARN